VRTCRPCLRFGNSTIDSVFGLTYKTLLEAVVLCGSARMGLAYFECPPGVTSLPVLLPDSRPRPKDAEAAAVTLGVRRPRHAVRGEVGGEGGRGGTCRGASRPTERCRTRCKSKGHFL